MRRVLAGPGRLRGSRAWRISLAALCALAVTGCFGAMLPASVGADATVEPAPVFSSAPGLPDGRVYEQASPANKNGNSEDATGYSIATSDGNGVLFKANGAIGDAVGSLGEWYVARRSTGGWDTTALLPRETESSGSFLEHGAIALLPSSSLSEAVFTSLASFVSPGDPFSSSNIYLAGPEPTIQPAWIAEPKVADPVPALGQGQVTEGVVQVSGAAADLSRVYFSYEGTLLAEDASRVPYIHVGRTPITGPAGFYEWTRGDGLKEAGVLPDGQLSPYGARQATEFEGQPEKIDGAGIREPADFNNVVSADGSRGFFLSPDPVAFAEGNVCVPPVAGGCVPQLYVRETEADGVQRTVLVSKSSVTGEPAQHGPLEAYSGHGNLGGTTMSFVYASPDGSRAFFASVDALTGDAPNDGEPKEYEFDTATGSLIYLPGVAGSGGAPAVRASSYDGSRLLFLKKSANFEILTDVDLWSAGPGGGTVTKIASLPAASGGWPTVVPSVRATADGSVFVFQTNAPLPGGFNNAAGYQEVYRYDTSTASLACVSCPPAGIAPSGDAQLSNSDIKGDTSGKDHEVFGGVERTVATRGISTDGSRVFFETPDPLVPQDSNGVRDVYEWENGTVYPISSGTAVEDSFLMDSSASGDDVFFATAAGLLAGDTDGGYDVYDARVPRPEDNPPVTAVACQGSVCQGPPRVPSPLGAPTSATFSGLGNVSTAEASPARKARSVKRKPKRRPLKKRKKAGRSNGKRKGKG